ncbi:flavin reductase family protein [Aliiroseovarius crassostreae]|uniref:flavin reductase family protein n=1 Tax=Aliiroseovarius crassostreae TaxID=154981 RepID=UPI0021FA9C3A|nr:flavin reductase family protein [Aliiroseovarius crassostreae]UWQ07156.1 flavin reductase family protein [Aliiroseovarius crassostreae]
MREIDPRALRNAFGAFLTGVCVVTTHDAEGHPVGFTANSFSSVSLDPPLVLVCLANTSSNYNTFAQADGFAVNILSEGQIDVSNTFARPVSDRFAAVDWQAGPKGSPIFSGTSAWFDCSMFNTIEAGDHLILIGQVEAFENGTAPGLGYARGAYVTPAAEVEALSNQADLIISALIEHNGKVLLVDTQEGKLTLPETKVKKDGASAALTRLIDGLGISADPGFIYSVYEDENRGHQHISFLCQAAEGTPAQGRFSDLSPAALKDIADPAMRTMLERFAAESRMGNFGVYYGNRNSGHVRPLSQGSSSK